MGRKAYTGSDITITFDLKRCIHARNCFLQLSEVFDPSKRPWVQPDAAPPEEISAVIRTCPSGALAFQRADGADEKPAKINRVTVFENGPLVVAGDVRIEGQGSEPRVALCRCGQSDNKPYCDGNHVKAGFKATGEPLASTTSDVTEQGGEVSISRVPDGPLKVAGHIEICCGTGRKICKSSKAFLCRCGASENKPFCDGSHKKIGFKDS